MSLCDYNIPETETIRISSVIPVYNRKNTIARAIDSVLAQEYPASEIIVVDDGSEDHTSEIVENYGEKVRYVYQDNSGVAAARNRGVHEAKCEWIAFLDSDDYWLPHHLKQITDVMRMTEGKAALYFSDLRRPVNEGGGTYWDVCGFSIAGSYEFKWDASEWALLKTQPMMTQASVIRRERYVEMGGVPRRLVTREDTLIFYKLCLLYPVCAVSGSGAVMSSDGEKTGRLTVLYDGSTSTFHECTKLLYKELLRYSGKMRHGHRKTIRKMLVGAHLDFGRVLIKQKQFLGAMANIVGGVSISPIISTGFMIQMLKSYYSRRLGSGMK
jgi:glycosyltransferase involved in cell wall biosynthesis